MVRSWRLIGVYLVIGVLALSSCVKDVENVEAEYFYGNHRGESVVLGRIGVVEAGVEKYWESPRVDPFTETSFQVSIRGNQPKVRGSHYLRGDGYFCLGLPPGNYTLWRWVYRFPEGQAKPVEPLPVYFDVLPGKTIYIGTLYIHLPPVSLRRRTLLGEDWTKPRYEIVDEYITAMEVSKGRYPNFPHSLERHLLYFSR